MLVHKSPCPNLQLNLNKNVIYIFERHADGAACQHVNWDKDGNDVGTPSEDLH